MASLIEAADVTASQQALLLSGLDPSSAPGQRREAFSSGDAYASSAAYHGYSDLLAQMQDGQAANTFITTAAKLEEVRLKKMDAATRRDVYLLRQRVLTAASMARKDREVAFVIAIALCVVLITLLPLTAARAGRISSSMGVALAGGVLAVALAALALWIARLSARRDDAFERRIWALSPQLAKELKAAQG